MRYKGLAYVHTIGCQMNVYDSEKLMAILNAYGFEKTSDMDNADIVVCNTCSIRHKAQEKAFSFLGRFNKKTHDLRRPITIMAGCVAQQEGKKAFERLPHLNMVLGARAFSRFGKHIDTIKSGGDKIVDTDDAPMIYDALPDSACLDENKISKFVTIMQGCENFCTYCVVPYVRGKERSRDAKKIIKEISMFAKSGVKEITLLGQNVNSYGKNEGDVTFVQLLREVNQIPGIQRIRFATSHPKDLSVELMRAIHDLDKVCNHLHLPVQSGSNAILKRMNRGYTRQIYIRKIKELRTVCPDIALSTDIIVGFPSETQKDFSDTLNLLHEIEFDSIFAFAYSDRPRTPAARFSNQIEETQKRDRLNAALKIQKAYACKKNSALIGEKLDVLVEGISPQKRSGYEPRSQKTKQMTGRAESGKIVHFPSENDQIGNIIKIRIENAYPHSLWGHPLGEQRG